ncbi:MAG: M48 family metallopeptidase [Methylophilaceae bacterium]|nr:M48 family metallopeptidase [Methylophilaceae bacterium]
MAEFQLLLKNGEVIPYQLQRTTRRTVGLKISATGLVIHAPKRISQVQLESLILPKADWIRKKLAAQLANKVDAIQWKNGEPLLFLGNDIALEVKHDARNKALTFDAGVLTVAQINIDDTTTIQRKVILWYQKQALPDFARRLEVLSAKLGVPKPQLFLSNAKSRWGSCNSLKEVRLNWRLMLAPPHIINYVICHELAHLKEMNHSTKFWAVVGSIYPDYKQAEKDLKVWSPQLHRL